RADVYARVVCPTSVRNAPKRAALVVQASAIVQVQVSRARFAGPQVEFQCAGRRLVRVLDERLLGNDCASAGEQPHAVVAGADRHWATLRDQRLADRIVPAAWRQLNDI